MSVLEQIVETEKSHGYCGSEEMIRDHFHTFLKRQLVQMIKSISSFRQFLSACKEYQQSRRSPRGESKHKHGQDYAKMEDEQEAANEYTKGDNDYPPIISSEVTGIPFPNLLLCSSFSYFLQFHNPQMPDILGETSTPQLQIEGYDYVLRLNPNEFISYNWLDKKLAFGKGKTNSY